MNQGLSKIERLKSRKQIDHLFSKNQSVFSYPFKFIISTATADIEVPAKLLISVSKRTFKHAVDRNRMKRLIREAYRKNKMPLYTAVTQKDATILIGLIFVGKELMNYHQVEIGIQKGLEKLIIFLEAQKE